jgi:hypothetical protein
MHPELAYRIATLRHEELVRERRAPSRPSRWQRLVARRRTVRAAGTPSPPVALLTPPREGDRAAPERRVA